MILFFAKTILLTPSAIDIINSKTIILDDPIKAITTGASIQIDVTSMISYTHGEDIVEFRKTLFSILPKNSIRGMLVTKNNMEIQLDYKGKHLFNEQAVLLTLSKSDGIPLDKEFEKVIIETDNDLKSVKILWKNFKK